MNESQSWRVSMLRNRWLTYRCFSLRCTSQTFTEIQSSSEWMPVSSIPYSWYQKNDDWIRVRLIHVYVSVKERERENDAWRSETKSLLNKSQMFLHIWWNRLLELIERTHRVKRSQNWRRTWWNTINQQLTLRIQFRWLRFWEYFFFFRSSFFFFIFFFSFFHLLLLSFFFGMNESIAWKRPCGQVITPAWRIVRSSILIDK